MNEGFSPLVPVNCSATPRLNRHVVTPATRVEGLMADLVLVLARLVKENESLPTALRA